MPDQKPGEEWRTGPLTDEDRTDGLADGDQIPNCPDPEADDDDA